MEWIEEHQNLKHHRTCQNVPFLDFLWPEFTQHTSRPGNSLVLTYGAKRKEKKKKLESLKHWVSLSYIPSSHMHFLTIDIKLCCHFDYLFILFPGQKCTSFLSPSPFYFPFPLSFFLVSLNGSPQSLRSQKAVAAASKRNKMLWVKTLKKSSLPFREGVTPKEQRQTLVPFSHPLFYHCWSTIVEVSRLLTVQLEVRLYVARELKWRTPGNKKVLERQ